VSPGTTRKGGITLGGLKVAKGAPTKAKNCCLNGGAGEEKPPLPVRGNRDNRERTGALVGRRENKGDMKNRTSLLFNQKGILCAKGGGGKGRKALPR